MNFLQNNTKRIAFLLVLFILCIFMVTLALSEMVQFYATVNAKEVQMDSDIVQALEDKPKPMTLEDFPKITVIATGYFAGYKSTGKKPGHPAYGITYSGVKVRRDLYSTIAADLNVFPLGTILYIPDYGYGIVTDTGGKIIGNTIDLYFETEEDVYKLWGKRKVDVFIIKEGDGTVTEAMLHQLNEDQFTFEQITQ